MSAAEMTQRIADASPRFKTRIPIRSNSHERLIQLLTLKEGHRNDAAHCRSVAAI
jgi:hypothetical protein